MKKFKKALKKIKWENVYITFVALPYLIYQLSNMYIYSANVMSAIILQIGAYYIIHQLRIEYKLNNNN